jgi:hypothetical protein
MTPKTSSLIIQSSVGDQNFMLPASKSEQTTLLSLIQIKIAEKLKFEFKFHYSKSKSIKLS